MGTGESSSSSYTDQRSKTESPTKFVALTFFTRFGIRLYKGKLSQCSRSCKIFFFSFMARKAHHMRTFWAISFTAALSNSVHDFTGSVTLESTTLFLLSKGHVFMHSRDLSARVRTKPSTLRHITRQQYQVKVCRIIIQNIFHERVSTQTHDLSQRCLILGYLQKPP